MTEKIESNEKNIVDLLADIKSIVVSSQRTGKPVKLTVDVKGSSVHLTETHESFTKYRTNS
jgi:hypothetical protein